MADSDRNPPPGGASQAEQAHRRLLTEIEAGRMTPGMRLRESEIAARFGLSRTPVREAIRLLEADGLIDHLPRQGATVRTLDYAEVAELYEMRAVFGGTAARLAARVASEVEIRGLFALNADFAAAETPQLAATLNRRFHTTLQESARNRFLVRSAATLDKAMLLLGPTTMMASGRIAEAAAEHERILKAIEARDGLRAEAEMRAHLEAAQLTRLRRGGTEADEGGTGND